MKSEFTTGSYTAERDFLTTTSVRYRIIIDVDELAGTSYHAQVYTRETETDSWGLMGGLAAEAADANGVFEFDRSRYVKVEITITGGDVPNGVIGYVV